MLLKPPGNVGPIWEPSTFQSHQPNRAFSEEGQREVGRNTVHWEVFSLKQMGKNHEF